MSDEVDLQQVLREIDQEVRARRAAGDFPPGMERELDAIFARYAPVAATGDDLDGLLEATERASFIDPDPPTGSRLPAVSILKRGERKLLGWFFRYLANQVTSFAVASHRLLEVLARRVEALEAASPAAHPAVAAEVARLASAPVRGAAVDVALAAAGQAGGRVLVADVGNGELLRSLVERGADAYGVDPDVDRAAAAESQGLEVRHAAVVEHLRTIAPEDLGGALLVGCVDRLPTGAQLDVADALTVAVKGGGRLAVLARHPDAWARDNPVEADLSPGRPLRPATWVHLLGDRGFVDIEVVEGDGAYAVTATRQG
jgi:hypothetical protein